MKLKKNDIVQVITGRYKGQKGRIIKVYPEKNRVIVEGINISTKHVKASTGAKQTGLVQQESPIHISNLIFKDPDSGKAGRIKIYPLI